MTFEVRDRFLYKERKETSPVELAVTMTNFAVDIRYRYHYGANESLVNNWAYNILSNFLLRQNLRPWKACHSTVTAVIDMKV